jgi:hypothetical protein
VNQGYSEEACARNVETGLGVVSGCHQIYLQLFTSSRKQVESFWGPHSQERFYVDIHFDIGKNCQHGALRLKPKILVQTG